MSITPLHSPSSYSWAPEDSANPRLSSWPKSLNLRDFSHHMKKSLKKGGFFKNCLKKIMKSDARCRIKDFGYEESLALAGANTVQAISKENNLLIYLLTETITKMSIK